MKFDRFAQWLANHSGRPLTFVIALMLIVLGRKRASISFQRHMAAGYQYVDHDHHIPDGVPDPEYPKP